MCAFAHHSKTRIKQNVNTVEIHIHKHPCQFAHINEEILSTIKSYLYRILMTIFSIVLKE